MYRARLFLAVSVAVVLWPVNAGASVTIFSYTGGEQTYVVPAGVDSLSVTATGAAGGPPVSGSLPAGRGAVVSGVVDVTPGQVLYVEVGGAGGSPAGGFNGGGDSGVRNGINVSGGGGASDVRTLPMGAGVISLPSRLIVAAGGGGSASPAAGGGDAGATGGSIPLFSGVGGGAGTLTAGGAGGCNALQTGCGMSGSLGNGGTGGSSGDGAQTREGAGGGGGLYGGGGGAGVLDGSVGGGGGGSSLVPSELGSMSLASLTTAPVVGIAPVPPPTCQNVTLSTPYGRAAIVQLQCTEFAGRALTYAIVGQPVHGRLSGIAATGRVTYTPDAGFSGDDSFAYDASSTNGTSITTSVSIAVIPPSVARAGHARRSKPAEDPGHLHRTCRRARDRLQCHSHDERHGDLPRTQACGGDQREVQAAEEDQEGRHRGPGLARGAVR